MKIKSGGAAACEARPEAHHRPEECTGIKGPFHRRSGVFDFSKVQVSLGSGKAQGQGAQSKKQAKAQSEPDGPAAAGWRRETGASGEGAAWSRSLGWRRRRFGGGVRVADAGEAQQRPFLVPWLAAGRRSLPTRAQPGMGAVRRRRRREDWRGLAFAGPAEVGSWSGSSTRRGRRLFSRCWETGRPLWRGMTALWACDFGRQAPQQGL